MSVDVPPFSNGELDDLRRLALKTVPIDAVATAFIGGSTAAGFANARSDIDIVVLLNRPFLELGVPSASAQTFLGEGENVTGLRLAERDVEIEMWSYERCLAMLESISSWQGDSVDQKLDPSIFETLLDAMSGIALINERELEVLTQPRYRRALGYRLVTSFVEEGVSRIEDARGAAESGDGATAMLASRQALDAAVDATTASHGSFNPKGKWRFKKLRKLQLFDLESKYLELQVEESTSNAALVSHSHERIALAEELLRSAQLHVRSNSNQQEFS